MSAVTPSIATDIPREIHLYVFMTNVTKTQTNRFYQPIYRPSAQSRKGPHHRKVIAAITTLTMLIGHH